VRGGRRAEQHVVERRSHRSGGCASGDDIQQLSMVAVALQSPPESDWWHGGRPVSGRSSAARTSALQCISD